jgi:formylglycine-generating enzyme required for sulfatase activity
MKLKALTLLLAAVAIGLSANAQLLKKLPRAVQKELKDLEFVKGDSLKEFIPYKGHPSVKKPAFRAVVNDFYLSNREVTNDDWRAFYKVMVEKHGKEGAKRFLPDTTVWVKSFPYSYNQPMMDFYYYHPAYAKYPVVGVTWNQAKAYCDWKTEDINNKLKADGRADVTVNLRLPTATEWELAALPKQENYEKGILTNASKGGYGKYLWNLTPYSYGLINKLGYQANFGPITDTLGFTFKSYVDDGLFHTGPVRCYYPNDKGMYNLRGNVEEWVSDVTDAKTITPGFEAKMIVNPNETNTDMRVCKGGSWCDGPYYLSLSAGKNYPANTASPFTGFRVAMDIVEVKPAASK